MAQRAHTPVFLEQEKQQGRRQQHGRLDHQARQCTERGGLLHETVGGKTRGQNQGHPRQRAVLPGQKTHPEAGEDDRQPLEAVEAFVQNRHPERHAEKRVDVITEAGLDNAVVIDRPDVGEPVDRQQQRCNRVHAQCPTLPPRQPQPARFAPQRHQQGQEPERPHNPMSQDLCRRHGLDRLPVQRQHPPHPIRPQGKPGPSARF